MPRIFWTLVFSLFAASAQAFCGFYVAKADGELYNEASKVVFVRNGTRSVITMASDYRGAPKDFALVIPTPRVLLRDQIRTVQADTIAHLDSYSAPRLVEYYDYDPCSPPVEYAITALPSPAVADSPAVRAKAMGVTIEAQYAVGTYDILILGAQESDGLTAFLTGEGYQLPNGAEAVLGDYIAKGMKFFVARVNLQRHSNSATKELPPLQIEFNSDKFMLPIQLGKLNADGAQDALFFMLAKEGRVRPANYAALDLPSNFDVPLFIQDDFGAFYKALFAKAAPEWGGIVTEYAWDMSWCDPCATSPLSVGQLAELGVDWLPEQDGPARDVFVTRLHARYTKDQMPEDIAFRITDDRQNFQGRYVMNHPFTGELTCDAGETYVQDTRMRFRQEAAVTAKLTGWRLSEVEDKVRATVPDIFW